MNTIYVVGIGPGQYGKMTLEAVNALRESDVIVGYTVYVDLVRKHFPGTEFLTTPMRKEAERCRMAFEEAMKGRTVAMICSGDAGVYGMSGLMYEIGAAYPQVELKPVGGLTAATSGALVLGAPLIHDFAVISLSDLLTPWEKIEKRLLLAAEADFVICLYNPSSRKRKDYLQEYPIDREPVYLRSFIKIYWNTFDELHIEEDEESLAEPLRNDNRQECSYPSELIEHYILRDHQYLEWHHH